MENYDGYSGCLRRRMRASRDTTAGYVEISILKHMVLKINFYVPSRMPVGGITVFKIGCMLVHIIANTSVYYFIRGCKISVRTFTYNRYILNTHGIQIAFFSYVYI